jgi:hypothetical protein
MQIKPIIANKFWIVEDNDRKIGTINAIDGKFKAIINGETKFFDSWDDFENPKETVPPEARQKQHEVFGYPTNCKPFNPSWLEEKKIATYTKSETSKITFCAGYYVIKFDTGWAVWFCVKLDTLNKRDWVGPLKTELEAREQKRIRN